MKMKKHCCVLSLCALILAGTFRCADPVTPAEARLMIRCDDIGMCHAVNEAARQLIESGLPFSASVMFPCPWYQEAVDILKAAENVSVGVHLTLNAEWKNYRWGPVLGREAVPSLVDSCGYFFPSRAAFFDHDPVVAEVERELRAQIERALSTGLQIDYLDYHMSTAVSTPELMAVVENLAREYQLGISRCFGEVDMQSIYSVAPEAKTDSLVAIIDRIDSDQLNLGVYHIGRDVAEMQAMQDLNAFGLKEMSRHRSAERQALLSPEFRARLQEKNVKLLTYKDLIAEVGLKNMQPPRFISY